MYCPDSWYIFASISRTSDPSIKVNSTWSLTASTLLHRLVYWVSASFTQCLGDTVQSGTGKVDPARTFKCTTAVRGVLGNVLQLTGLKFVQLRHSLGPTLPAVTPTFNKCINIHRITNKWWDFIIKRRLYWIHIVFFLKFLWFPAAVNLFLSLS